MLIALGWLTVAIWLCLLIAHHGFWRVAQHLSPDAAEVQTGATVVVVVPARNEAEHIQSAVKSLAPSRVIVVDDNSEDGTGELAREAGATVVAGRPLPPGWTGKMWAVAQGIAEATLLKPDYLLLTDADIQHAPGEISDLVRIAESGQYDLVSYMVKLSCETLPEKLLIPAFVFFFFLLYPPAAIRSPRSKIAGAAGGCMLIRVAALQRVGGIETIRSQVIDDCALAKVVKASGGRVWLGLTPATRSLRHYVTFGEIERMISRTAFNQLRHSWLLLLGTAAGLVLTYLVPVALLSSHRLTPVLLGGSAWLLMSIAYAPTVRFYGRPVPWAVTLPFAGLFYLSATIHSAVLYATGRGGQWKGRSQDVKVTS